MGDGMSISAATRCGLAGRAVEHLWHSTRLCQAHTQVGKAVPQSLQLVLWHNRIDGLCTALRKETSGVQALPHRAKFTVLQRSQIQSCAAAAGAVVEPPPPVAAKDAALGAYSNRSVLPASSKLCLRHMT